MSRDVFGLDYGHLLENRHFQKIDRFTETGVAVSIPYAKDAVDIIYVDTCTEQHSARDCECNCVAATIRWALFG